MTVVIGSRDKSLAIAFSHRRRLEEGRQEPGDLTPLCDLRGAAVTLVVTSSHDIRS